MAAQGAAVRGRAEPVIDAGPHSAHAPVAMGGGPAPPCAYAVHTHGDAVRQGKFNAKVGCEQRVVQQIALYGYVEAALVAAVARCRSSGEGGSRNCGQKKRGEEAGWMWCVVSQCGVVRKKTAMRRRAAS